MGKIQNDQRGFSVVEIVLVVVIVVLIGAVGWLVNKNYRKTSVATTTTKLTAKPVPTKTAAAPNPYAGWRAGRLQYEKISYKYPIDWMVTDKSVALAKSANSCTYPGHDLVTLKSPSGNTIDFNAGQDCFGYNGDKFFDSMPMYSLGQHLYLVFLGGLMNPSGEPQPDSACLAQTSQAHNRFDFKSKNIFYNSTESGSDPVNSFCYLAKDATSVDAIKNSSDFATAKLMLESMHY